MEGMDIELGKRAVACKRWRWMPGMRSVPVDESESAGRVFATDSDGEADHDANELSVWLDEPINGDGWLEDCWDRVAPADVLPDLSDPATLGCLLVLVREAWGAPRAGVQADDAHWVMRRMGSVALVDRRFGTEAEALVAALETAP